MPNNNLTDKIFGVDMVFQEGFQLQNTDYLLVAGLENLKRSIYRRLVTNTGAFRVRPTYGCGVPSYVKRPASTTTLLELKHKIVNNLLQDPRIQKVDVTVATLNQEGAKGLQVVVKVLAGGNQLPPFNFTFF